MPNMRQHVQKRIRLDGSVIVRTHPLTMLSEYRSNEHAHEWDQLTYASQGVMTVYTAKRTWVVPPHRALWVPAGTKHTEEMSAGVAVRSLYFVPGLSPSMPRECSALNVTPLLRELILHAIAQAVLDERIPAQAQLAGVILNQLEMLPTVPLQLPALTDPRARKVSALLEKEPDNQSSLAEIARQAGASGRTLERIFKAETGMHFRHWRQRLRLIHALRLLAGGESVTQVALEAGYGSTSAFIAMFNTVFGTTPGRFFRPNSSN